MTRAGAVVALHRHRVKAMAAEVPEEAEIDWLGVAGDRRRAFVQTGHHGDFPWLTMRQVPSLTRYVPAAHGGPVHLLHSFRGLFDVSAVSVLSLRTVAGMSELTGRELVPLRLRPNIVIDAPGSELPEEALVGRELRIGGARIRIDLRDRRCAVVNFDPTARAWSPASSASATRCSYADEGWIRPGPERPSAWPRALKSPRSPSPADRGRLPPR